MMKDYDKVNGTLWQLSPDKAKEDSFEKISFGDTKVVLDKKTKLGTKGCVTFSDGCQLVVSHEQDGFGQDWHYLVSLEKTNLDRDKGITRIDVIESCLTKNLDTAKRAGKEMVVNCQLSEGKSVVA